MAAAAPVAEPESRYYGAQIVTFHTSLYRDQQLLLDRGQRNQDGLYHVVLLRRNLVGDKHKQTLHLLQKFLPRNRRPQRASSLFWVQMQCLRKKRSTSTIFMDPVSGLK